MNEANTLSGEAEIAPEEAALFALILEHFDAAHYLEIYTDVAQAGVDPLEHWLEAGYRDGRQISRMVELRYGKIARRSTNRNWKHYRWRGQDIAARVIEPIPPEIMAQIHNQARHDPEVLAAGAERIANHGHRENAGVLDVAGLQRAIPHGAEFLLIVPNLSMNGDEGFLFELVAALNDVGFRSIQTVITDQEKPEDFDDAAIPKPFRGTNVLFWQDFWIRDPGLIRLAQLVSLFQPRVTIVANSRLGRDLIVQFGRALSRRTEIYCIYAEASRGGDFDVRFPRRTLPFATGLTDDTKLGARLHDLYGDLLGHGVVVLPRHSPPAFRDAVAALFRQP